MSELSLNQLAIYLVAVASITSLVLIVAKPLAKEFEATVTQWIRAFKRLKKELRKPPAQQQKALSRIRSKPS